jgi:hypothetical protein
MTTEDDESRSTARVAADLEVAGRMAIPIITGTFGPQPGQTTPLHAATSAFASGATDGATVFEVFVP